MERNNGKKYGYRILYAIASVFFAVCCFQIIEGLLAIRIVLSLVPVVLALIFLDASEVLPFRINKRYRTPVSIDYLGFFIVIFLFVKAVC
ncbi:MAG: hypothetical protein ACI3YK_03765 [Eubacteriales bacterium]